MWHVQMSFCLACGITVLWKASCLDGVFFHNPTLLPQQVHQSAPTTQQQ